MAIGPIGAAALVEALSEGAKKLLSEIMGKAATETGKVVERKIKESLGGRGVIDDEIAYEQLVEEKIPAEVRQILDEFHQMKRLSFGTDPKAVEAYRDWDNDFRQSVLKRRVSGRSKTVTKTVKKKDGTATTTSDEQNIPGTNQPAIDFLLRFAAHMQVERDKWKTAKKKREAGFQAGQAYLDNYNLPSDRPSAIGNKVKEVAASIPGTVKDAYTSLKGHVGAQATKVDDWILREHAKLPVEPTPREEAIDSPRRRARANY